MLQITGRFLLACVEDGATLESNPSGGAGGHLRNGIPDGYEFYLLERILVEGSARPGVSQAMFEETVAAWSAIREDVEIALGGHADAAGMDAITAYLMLGDAGSRFAANYVVSRNWPASAWSNVEAYGNGRNASGILGYAADPDNDGFGNLAEYEFARLHYPDPALRAEKHVEAALDPAIPGPGYDPALVETVTVDLVVYGYGTVGLPMGIHEFARYLPRTGCELPCPQEGEPPVGCGPCSFSTLQLQAVPAEGWVFHSWGGVEERLSAAQLITMNTDHVLYAEFIPRRDAPQLRAAVDQIFGIDYDGNQTEYDGNGNIVLGPNGYLESDEFGLLEDILAEPALDLTEGHGVAHEFIRKAWEHNLAQARVDWGNLATNHPERALVTAAYMTLGGMHNVKAANELIASCSEGGRTLSLAHYDYTMGRYLRPNGDADGDGIENSREYGAGGGDPGGLPCILSPGCRPDVLDVKSLPEDTSPLLEPVRVLVNIVGGGNWWEETAGEIVLEPEPDIDHLGFLCYPVGTVVRATYIPHDETYGFISWDAPNTELDLLESPSGEFVIRQLPSMYSTYRVDAVIRQSRMRITWNPAYFNCIGVQETGKLRILTQNCSTGYLDLAGPPGHAFAVQPSMKSNHHTGWYYVTPGSGTAGTWHNLTRDTGTEIQFPVSGWGFGQGEVLRAAHSGALAGQTRRGTLRTRSSAGGFVAAGYIHGYASSMPAMPPWRSRATSAYQNPEWGNPSATLFPAPNPGYQFTHYSEYPHESALSPLSGNVSVRGEFAPNRPFTLTTSAIIHGDKNGLPADFDPNGLLRVDTMKSGYWANGQARVEIPANLPHGLAFSHWEAVGNPGQQQPGPEKDARYWLSDEFAVNVKPAECPEVVAVLTRPKITAVEWRPFEEYANIEDPPAGAGQAIFPGAATPSGAARNRVRVRAQVAATTARTRVYFRLFDVDDPSSDTAPIDPNGPDGNDNIDQSAQLSQQSALCTVASANFSGYAEVTLDNVSMRPGDNYRVAVSLVESALQPHNYPLGNANSGTDPADGAITEMLTVWRRLHIEEYEMGPAGSNEFFGTAQGNVIGIKKGVVRVDHEFTTPMVEGAIIGFSGGAALDSICDQNWIVKRAASQGNYTDLHFEGCDNFLTDGIDNDEDELIDEGPTDWCCPPGHPDGDVDDCPVPGDCEWGETGYTDQSVQWYLNSDDAVWAGGPQGAIEQMRPYFHPMYVDLIPLGSKTSVPFVHNLDVSADGTFVDNVPVIDPGSPSFWTVSLLWAYEPFRSKPIPTLPCLEEGDIDPNSEQSYCFGMSSAISGESAIVFVEQHRDALVKRPDAVIDVVLTAVHEVGHLLGLRHAELRKVGEQFVPEDLVNDDGLMRWEGVFYDHCSGASAPVILKPPFNYSFSANNMQYVRAMYVD